MKISSNVFLLFGVIWAVLAHTQTTYVFYDQVSPLSGYAGEGGIQVGHPGDADAVGQSFTPFGSRIDFIDLMVSGKGTFYVLLRSESPDGPVIASTDPIAICSPPGPPDWTRFYFPSRVPLEADVTYYFQPFIVDGNAVIAASNGARYTAGTAFRGPTAIRGWDLWFREGSILVVPAIPEPSTLALALAGLPALVWRIHKWRRLSVRVGR